MENIGPEKKRVGAVFARRGGGGASLSLSLFDPRNLPMIGVTIFIIIISFNLIIFTEGEGYRSPSICAGWRA